MEAKLKIGGECEWSAITRVEAVISTDSADASTTPRTTGAIEVFTDVGWAITDLVVGIVLQQSSPR